MDRCCHPETRWESRRGLGEGPREVLDERPSPSLGGESGALLETKANTAGIPGGGIV